MSEEHLHAFCEGHVQGVGFRWFTMRRAREWGLRGWVRNLDDGRVELRAEGSREKLERLLADLRTGPPGSRVRQVQVEWAPATGDLREFTVAD